MISFSSVMNQWEIKGFEDFVDEFMSKWLELYETVITSNEFIELNYAIHSIITHLVFPPMLNGDKFLLNYNCKKKLWQFLTKKHPKVHKKNNLNIFIIFFLFFFFFSLFKLFTNS